MKKENNTQNQIKEFELQLKKNRRLLLFQILSTYDDPIADLIDFYIDPICELFKNVKTHEDFINRADELTNITILNERLKTKDRTAYEFVKSFGKPGFEFVDYMIGGFIKKKGDKNTYCASEMFFTQMTGLYQNLAERLLEFALNLK